MNAAEYLAHGWNWNPLVILALAMATLAYARFVGRRGQPGLFAVAVTLVAIAFLSPLNLLAAGVLFTAHMAQHIILLLLVPGLVLVSLPADRRAYEWSDPGNPCSHEQSHTEPGSHEQSHDEPRSHERSHDEDYSHEQSHRKSYAIFTWMFGVGSMWFWHVPQLCNAAASSSWVHTAQTVSLLGLGTAFWWPILAPRAADRLGPGVGIIYLFTACLACTGLGILLTLTSVDVCPIFRAPSSAPAMWTALRGQLTAQRDQQIGGLLMWLPMCLVYVAAIILELARWLGEPAPTFSTAARKHS